MCDTSRRVTGRMAGVLRVSPRRTRNAAALCILVLSVLFATCVETSTTLCGTGAAARRCGLGAVCVDGERCEQATNVVACDGLTDGAECVLDGRELGHCRTGVCARTFCGDRVIDNGEVCDDGNARDGDGCSADCASSEVCGNGLVDTAAHEQCDNAPRGMSGDGCNSRCGLESLVFDSPEIAFGENSAFVFDRSRNVPVLIARDLTGVMEWRGTHWETFYREPPFQLTEKDLMFFASSPITGQAMVLTDRAAALWTGNGWQRVAPFAPLNLLQLLSPPHFFLQLRENTRTKELTAFYLTDGGLFESVHWTGTQWNYKKLYTSNGSASTSGVRTQDWHVYNAANNRWLIIPRDLRSGLRRNTLQFTANLLDVSLSNFVVTYGPPLPSATEMPDVEVRGVVINRQVPTIVVGRDFWELANNVWRKLPDRMLPYEGANVDCAAVGTMGHYCFDSLSLQRQPDQTSVSISIIYRALEAIAPAMRVAYNPWIARTVAVGVPADEPDSPLRVLQGHGLHGARATSSTDGSRPVARSGFSWTASDSGFWLFGGSPQTSSATQVEQTWLADLWRWTGTNWQIENSAMQAKPSARGEHCAFFDSRLHELVVFGGLGNAVLGDTWIFDGTSWLEVAGNGPAPRRNAACAWDESRKVGYLFGGEAADGNYLNDMWQWNNRQWSEVLQRRALLPRTGASVVYHYKTGSVFLLGGYTTAGVINDVWEFQTEILTWVNRSTVSQDRVYLFNQSVAYDAIADSILIIPKFFGSLQTQSPASLKFVVAGTLPDACDGSDNDGDGLIACADPDCWARCQPTCLPHTECTSLVNTGPRCGDGACSAIEDSALCPQDCVE